MISNQEILEFLKKVNRFEDIRFLFHTPIKYRDHVKEACWLRFSYALFPFNINDCTHFHAQQ